jgi:uncharacterized repeat protein (TIGR04076 family)
MKTMIPMAQIRGHCPVYSVGDRFVLDQGYILDPAQSCRMCMHSLASVMPYYVALSHGVDAAQLGLNCKKGEVAHVQCLDPCEQTGGGTVILEIRQER